MPDIVVLGLALTALVVSGRWLIHILMMVTKVLGIPEFSVGFILLAVSTSLPEIFVGISSARQEAAALVMATALGSNLVNMTFIVGLAALLSLGVSTKGLRLRRDLLWGGGVTLMPVLFLANGRISRLEGILLLLGFCAYIWRAYQERQKKERRQTTHIRVGRGLGALVLMLGLVALLLVAADLTVSSATSLATRLHIPPFLVGVFILAFGTSLPELVTTLNAALLRRPQLALGNILGSNVADSGLVIGIAALVRPLQTPLTLDLIVTAGFVVLSLILLGWFVHTRQRLSMGEGLGLIVLFLVFGFILFLVSAPASFAAS